MLHQIECKFLKVEEFLSFSLALKTYLYASGSVQSMILRLMCRLEWRLSTDASVNLFEQEENGAVALQSGCQQHVVRDR